MKFLDKTLSLDERVRDLLSRLTIEEKAGLVPAQQAAIPRLGIPAYAVGNEGAHGFVDREGTNTCFPQTIGLASTWDEGLLARIGEVVGTEARTYYKQHNKAGGLSLWAPTIDMERDPRWGRTEEGYGEDPVLTGTLASAFILGAQGPDPFYLRVSCGPKHFLGNNNEKNRARYSCSIPPRALREYYLEPFRWAIEQGKAASLMTAYNEVNGIPMMLHPLLREVLKAEWGFAGHTVTDGGDFSQTVTMHHYFETHAESLAAAFKNGADTMTDLHNTHEIVVTAVLEALKLGLITERDLDEHVARILGVRFRFGHFDEGCPYENEVPAPAPERERLARDAVGESVVLLKNEGTLLPLASETKIAVLGPLADAVYFDWYTGRPPYVVSALSGLRAAYDEVLYLDCRDVVSFACEDGRPLVLLRDKTLAVGKQGEAPARFLLEDWGWGAYTLTSEATGLLLQTPFGKQEQFAGVEFSSQKIKADAKSSLGWFVTTLFNIIPAEFGKNLFVIKSWDNRRLAAPSDEGPILLRSAGLPNAAEGFVMFIEEKGIEKASACAAQAECVLFFAGSNPMINGREGTDRPSLQLPPRQEALLEATCAANPRTVLAIISSYPYTCGAALAKVPAALWLAHGMQELGHGLADICRGARSPAGRLPLTWYETENQLPPTMEYDIIKANSTYQYFTGPCLFPFGHGLTYTEFSYADLQTEFFQNNQTLRLSFSLKNIGKKDSDEVPQLYASVFGSRFKRPIKSLKGFKRVHLKAGEEQRIVFEVPLSKLAVWDPTRERFCVEKGTARLSVGASSLDLRLHAMVPIAGAVIPARSAFDSLAAVSFDNYSGCFLHEKRGSSVPAVFNKSGAGWLCYKQLDFGEGVTGLHAIVQGTGTGRIDLRVDGLDVPSVCSLFPPNTGDLCDYPLDEANPRHRALWAACEGKLEIRGLHDLYVVLHGDVGIWRFEFFA